MRIIIYWVYLGVPLFRENEQRGGRDLSVIEDAGSVQGF